MTTENESFENTFTHVAMASDAESHEFCSAMSMSGSNDHDGNTKQEMVNEELDLQPCTSGGPISPPSTAASPMMAQA